MTEPELTLHLLITLTGQSNLFFYDETFYFVGKDRENMFFSGTLYRNPYI